MVSLFNCVQITTLPFHARVLHLDIENHLTNTNSSKLKHINWDHTIPSFSHELSLPYVGVSPPHHSIDSSTQL
jgi:hypothetical protein